MAIPFKLTTLAAATFFAVTTAYAETNMVYQPSPTAYPTHTNTVVAPANVNPNSVNVISSNWFPLNPRLLAEGSWSDIGLFEGDAMIPIYGTSSQILYGDVDGRYGTDSAWYGSLGLGYRGLISNELLGIYVFGDRNELENNQRAWVINPGLELFSNTWDVHVNGYFTVGNKDKLENVFFADQLGLQKPVQFTGHTQFNNLYDQVSEVGPGADAEVGYSILKLHRTRLFVGGYFYRPENAGDIQGVEGGIEMPVTRHVSVILKDTYDNEFHNTALVTLRFSLGGVAKQDQESVADRILDPIERHVGVVQTGAGISNQTTIINTGRIAIERDNIYFFDANNGATFNSANGTNQCTFEHPCIGTSFTQSTVDSLNTIAPNTNFYFKPGIYSNFPATDPRVITMNVGQNLFGRTADYKASAATTGNLPEFDGGFNLLGNNTVDAIHIVLTDGGTAVTISGASNVILNQDVMDVSKNNDNGNNQASTNPVTGISLSNAQAINITNNTINVTDSEANENGGSQSADAVGVSAANGSNFTMQGSIVNVSAATGVNITDGMNTAASVGVDIVNSAGTLNQNQVSVSTYGTVFQAVGLERVTASGVGIHIESNNGQSANLTSNNNNVTMQNTAEANGVDTAIAQTIRDRDLEVESNNAGSQTTVTSAGDNFSSTNTANASGSAVLAVSGGNVISNNNFNTGNVGLFAVANDSGIINIKTSGSNFSSNNNATVTGTSNDFVVFSAIAGGNFNANGNVNAGNAGLFAVANTGSINITASGSSFYSTNTAIVNVNGVNVFASANAGGNNTSENNINSGNTALFAVATNNGTITIDASQSNFSTNNNATTNTSETTGIIYDETGGNANEADGNLNAGNAGLFVTANNGNVTINSSGNNFNNINNSTAIDSGIISAVNVLSGGNIVNSQFNTNIDNAALFADSENNGIVNVTATDNTFTASAVVSSTGTSLNNLVNSLFGVYANGTGTTVTISGNTFNLTGSPNPPINIFNNLATINGDNTNNTFNS